MPTCAAIFRSFLGLLALSFGSARVPALPPARALYCVPVAVRDYEVLVGRSAQVRPAAA